ncbi:protein lin-9 homolog [Drosophila innubila]|uniref:protein lin-9 homolog n=1 Tax=Drosophila innubila TaxID=198719 RepID=UPI00148CCA9A|nr:protein lin-9 homolog [Drosophila innubila]
MSKTNESQRLLRSQKADKEDDELFVKLPKFSKRARGKSTLDNQEEESVASAKELVPREAHDRLYKFLKQPNSHRWIWCEFVDSFIDQATQDSGFDVKWYLRSVYPRLEDNQLLPLRCWQLLRRDMGKARRFSPAFIESEKRELNRSRNMVRMLQQRKVDIEQFGMPLDVMPKIIPLPLAVDTKVISLLRAPLELLYKGRVVGYEPKDCSYLIKFDIAGKHIVLSMADSLLHVVHECKTISLASIIQEANETPVSSAADTDTTDTDKESKPLLDAVLQLQKLLVLKRKTVQDMAVMNEELEASGPQASNRREIKLTPQREKLQRRYAANMITLHRVNADILESLRVAHNHLSECEKDAQQCQSTPRKKIYEKCRLLAELDLKASPGLPNLKLQATRDLILRLQTLLYVCAEMRHGKDQDLDEVLEDYVANMMSNLPTQLHDDFQSVVAMLQPLREQIVVMHKIETDRCQQLLQIQQSETTTLVVTEEAEVDMCF